MQNQNKDYATRIAAFETEKLMWKNETRKELEQKKKLFENIMKEQKERYENTTMISLQDKIKNQEKAMLVLK